MIEVSHGPYLVDNNVFASPVMFQNWSQGGAFVNNLICGGIEPHTVPTVPRRITIRTPPRWPGALWYPAAMSVG